MTGKKTTHVSEEKKKIVKELANLIKNKKTVLIASIKNLPGSQFQEVVKKLRRKAIVVVPKKSLIFRAIDESGNEAVKKIKDNITESVAILFSDLDAFELAGELIKSKSAAKAKVGQEAPRDIEIEAGPTELVPGPAISELGALGIQIQIKDGKIEIKAQKIIVKQGEKISQGACDIMSKLDIKPFESGFIPVAGFDTKENKLYLDIKIDRAGTLESLKTSYSKSLAFAVEIEYFSEDTIKFILRKAAMEEKKLESLESSEGSQTKEAEEEKTGESNENVPQVNLEEGK
ncbi:MAG: 50S ribosomal protein L10 [Nanoarchaeota archaeon]|nr:50S ribosomal protein L10 [Nanoarchaeota archaeon]